MILIVLIAGYLTSLTHSLLANKEPPRCLTCTGVPHMWMCNEAVKCAVDEICMTERYMPGGGPGDGIQKLVYRSGCEHHKICEMRQYSSMPVGRRQSKDFIHCGDCCETDFCNVHNQCRDQGDSPTGGPLCYECRNAADISKCKQVTICATDEVCGVTKSMWQGEDVYNFQCIPKERCNIDCVTCCNGSFCHAYSDTTKISCIGVAGTPEFDEDREENLLNMLHDEVVVKCKSSGTQPIVYTWYRDNQKLNIASPCKRMCVIDGDLHLRNVDRLDGGNYSCDAVNSKGWLSGYTILQVLGAPEITYPEKLILAHPGEKISLECTVSGATNEHHLNFVFDKLKPSSAAITRKDDYTVNLNFTYTGLEDSGFFYCNDSLHRIDRFYYTVVAKDIGLLTCSSTFDQCPHIDGVACGGTCPTGCPYNDANKLFPHFDVADKVCSNSAAAVEACGGEVAWVMLQTDSRFKVRVAWQQARNPAITDCL